MKNENSTGWAAPLFVAWMIGSYITHIVVTAKTTSWSLLALGLLVPPIGMINGTGILLRLW